MRRALVPLAAAVLGVTLVAAPSTGSGAAAPDRPFPTSIALPAGFQPEGIALGRGATAWFGSLADGDIYQASLRTGAGSVVAEDPEGRPAVGMKSDRRGRLYVAGGDSGSARVVDTRTGETVRDYDLGSGPTFVNDVVLTKRAAWFTDSLQPRLFRVGRSPRGVPDSTTTTLPLTGEWEQGTGLAANGISTTPTGRALLVINSGLGVLYRVDPSTGVATAVDVGGQDLTAGDGLLRHGRTLYVVRNRENEVVVLRLDRQGTSGRLLRTITTEDVADSCTPEVKAAPCFDVPTTVARRGAHLYLPNARFGTSAPQPADYWVTKVRAKPRR